MALDDARPELQRALTGLRFGSVETVVHEGRVVQIERREQIGPGDLATRSAGRPPEG